MNITTVGITGANGHVGASVVRLLLEKGYKVKALIFKNSNALQGLEVELCYGDINNESSLLAFLENVDAVIHCAGFIGLAKHQAKTMHRINVDGTKNVVSACLKTGVEKLVYVSSVQAFNIQKAAVLNETAHFTTATNDAYSNSKYLGEEAVRKGVKQGLDACIVNPTSIIGPFDFNPGAQTKAILKIANKQVPALMLGGFDWVDVRDVAQGILGALLHGKTNENYLLSGHWHSLKDIAYAIARYMQHKPIRFYMPINLVLLAAYFVDRLANIRKTSPLITPNAINFIKNVPLSIEHNKATKAFNYKPRPFDISMQDTMNWLKEQNLIKEK